VQHVFQTSDFGPFVRLSQMMMIIYKIIIIRISALTHCTYINIIEGDYIIHIGNRYTKRVVITSTMDIAADQKTLSDFSYISVLIIIHIL